MGSGNDGNLVDFLVSWNMCSTEEGNTQQREWGDFNLSNWVGRIIQASGRLLRRVRVHRVME